MALRRSAYLKRGANYTEAATLLRCVQSDQSSATVRCHYLVDGTVNFALTMRRAEYFIPAGILLKCFLEVRGAWCVCCLLWFVVCRVWVEVVVKCLINHGYSPALHSLRTTSHHTTPHHTTPHHTTPHHTTPHHTTPNQTTPQPNHTHTHTKPQPQPNHNHTTPPTALRPGALLKARRRRRPRQRPRRLPLRPRGATSPAAAAQGAVDAGGLLGVSGLAL